MLGLTVPRSDVLQGLSPWEAAWSPYDEAIYRFVLDRVSRDDVVLDVGAGDLRLARRLAPIARRVIAIEINPGVLARVPADRPGNLSVICADARRVPFPRGTTVAVLLMRHCQHFALYVEKLRAVGCRRLITNARWRVGVEIVDLGPSPPVEDAEPGWYACKCGAVGLVPGTEPDDFATPEDMIPREVESCPRCV